MSDLKRLGCVPHSLGSGRALAEDETKLLKIFTDSRSPRHDECFNKILSFSLY